MYIVISNVNDARKVQVVEKGTKFDKSEWYFVSKFDYEQDAIDLAERIGG